MDTDIPPCSFFETIIFWMKRSSNSTGNIIILIILASFKCRQNKTAHKTLFTGKEWKAYKDRIDKIKSFGSKCQPWESNGLRIT